MYLNSYIVNMSDYKAMMTRSDFDSYEAMLEDFYSNIQRKKVISIEAVVNDEVVYLEVKEGDQR